MPRTPSPRKRGNVSPTQLNATILEIYRLGREAPYASFQAAALDAVQQCIPFDSAWWANAVADMPEIHRLHLCNCAPSILEDYAPYMEQDFFRATLIANPGRTVSVGDLMTHAELERTALYQDFGRKYRVEWSLGTLLVEPVSSLYEFLTLWRHDAKRPFSEAERQAKELLMPHLAQAHRSKLLASVMGETTVQSGQWAICDERGFLREATPGFVHQLQARWPQWQGSRLPEALLQQVQTAEDYAGPATGMAVVRRGGYRYVEVQAGSAVDSLSPREREIAQRYATGQTHAQIAAALGLSPATVRNHLARAYRKLAVNNKSELTLRLAARPAAR